MSRADLVLGAQDDYTHLGSLEIMPNLREELGSCNVWGHAESASVFWGHAESASVFFPEEEEKRGAHVSN